MPELLAPCGSIEALNAAVGEGADAIYLGLKTFNARMRSTNFSWSQVQAAVEAVHKRRKKIYVTLNTVVTQEELEELYATLTFLQDVGVDAIIVQDFGVLQMVKDFFPKLKVHASTQMNIASSKAVNAISRFGVSRVVLARELSLEEIRQIKKNSSCELEVFVHGALCISESGICLFSSFLGGKSANRGMCTQACRRLYTVEDNEKKQQGYFFSPYDLQLLQFIPELVEAGVSSFKIEGRMKSAEYVGTVVSAYRYMLDHYLENKKEAFENSKRILQNDFARKKTSFLFTGGNLDETLNPNQDAGTGLYVGKILDVASQAEAKALNKKLLDLEAKPETKTENQLETKKTVPVRFVTINSESGFLPQVGDSIRLHSKEDIKRESFKLKRIAEHAGKTYFEVPSDFTQGDLIYLLQTKAMTKRYSEVLPRSLSAFTKKPKLNAKVLSSIKNELKKFILEKESEQKEVTNGKQVAKVTKKGALNKSEKQKASKQEITFPDGFYVQVSSINDVHTLLHIKPTRVIINYNEDTERFLTEKGRTLPFPKAETIISFDPFLGEADLIALEPKVEAMLSLGFKNFIVNNPAHISLFRTRLVNLIAGPYLYSFNRFAVRWLHENKITTFVSPLENSYENLKATVSDFLPHKKSEAIITVFNYPTLFRIRKPLPENYGFTQVTDKTGEAYRLLNTPSRSFVLPERPFSITEKISTLQKNGFTKFLIDFSHTTIKKNDYKAIYNACINSEGLSDTSKFNWKEGFYNAEKVEALKKLSKKQ